MTTLMLPSVFRPSFGDEIILNSIDWLEDFPWRENDVKTDKDKYEIRLHVKDFGPTEITVKIVDGFIVIEGKHDERKDEHGTVSRHFIRRYQLPEECIAEKVESRLSADGVLIINAPKKPAARREKDTVIPVTINGSKSKAKL